MCQLKKAGTKGVLVKDFALDSYSYC